MFPKHKTPKPQRKADLRREPRWVDVRFVVAQIGDEKFVGLTGDVSLGGVQLALVGAEAQVGDSIRVEVGFAEEVIEEVVRVRGRVAYALPRRWGSLLGIHCPQQYGLARESLTRRRDMRTGPRPTAN